MAVLRSVFLWSACILAVGGIRAEAPRSLPVAYSVDVVVVGGSTGAVAAAVAAAESGAKVFLAAGHPYLGDDMTATLRLWREPGENPESPLAKAIFSDTPSGGHGPDRDALPFSYQACQKSDSPHKDSEPPSKLTDGLFGRANDQSVQYGGNIEITADLKTEQAIRGVRVVFYDRTSASGQGSFGVESVDIAVSNDKRKWTDAAKAMASDPEKRTDYQLTECFGLTVPFEAKSRYVRLFIKKPAESTRILLGEIEILGVPKPTAKKASSDAAQLVRPLHVKKTLDEALIRAGVPFLYSCYPSDVLVDKSGKPCGIVMANRAGRQAVLAKTIIDATDRAVVARLAGAQFEPYPAGTHTLRRVVIGGEACTGKGIAVRQVGVFRGSPAARDSKPTTEYPVFEYTLSLPMADASFASWAEAEQTARSLTYDPQQQFTSDDFFEISPDPMTASGQIERIHVLGGCAAIPREEAEKRLRPAALIDWGTKVGQAAAAEAKKLPAVEGAKVVARDGAKPFTGDVREFRAGVRPTEAGTTVSIESESLPVLGHYDVLVVGGGTAGSPAGIAAARQGAKTLVVEHLHMLGGVGTAGAISNYCCGNRVGFSATVLDDVLGNKKNSWPIEQKAQWWREALRTARADVWCGAIGCGAVVEGKRVCGAVVATPLGRGIVLAKAVVDATGNADVAAAAGSPCIYTDASEFGMQGTGLPPRQLGASYTNTDFNIVDDTDLVDVWHTFVYAKHKYPKAFDQGQLIDTRERRAVVGEFTMTVLDQVAKRTYRDTIMQARGGALDTHGYTVDPFLHFTHPNTNKLIVDVPYRCLLPKGVEGVLAAGIGMSVHRDALPLVRMQPDIENQGYAAGVAAAMSARYGKSLRQIDVRSLQKHLVEIGNLEPRVLEDRDAAPLSAEAMAQAIKSMNGLPSAAAAVFAQPAAAIPLLRKTHAAARDQDEQLGYATALSLLGDRSGVDTILAEVKKTTAWDKGWNYKAMGQFGNAMSPLDCQLVALGLAGDRRAVPVILEKLDLLTADSEFSHHRAAALALELLGDPAAAKPLAALLAKPNMRGNDQPDIDKSIERETPGGTNAEQSRRESIRELVLARALYRCGDCDGVGRAILTAYAHDLRGHLARHAKAVLDARGK